MLTTRTFPRTARPFLLLRISPVYRTMATNSAPGEQFEVRQTSATEDWHPDPSKSIPLDKARQALVDDIIALYSCEPTIERVKRYTPDCVYDDQFVYANDRYKMAGQWFALPKLFKASKNEGYEIVRSDDEVIQFKNEQVCQSNAPSDVQRTDAHSPGLSRSSRKPPQSTLSSPCLSIPRQSIATSSE